MARTDKVDPPFVGAPTNAAATRPPSFFMAVGAVHATPYNRQSAWTRRKVLLGTPSSAEHRLAPSVTHWVPDRAVTGFSTGDRVDVGGDQGLAPATARPPAGAIQAYPVTSSWLTVEQVDGTRITRLRVEAGTGPPPG